jgi:phytoene dehydrogenase-like protein
MLDVYMPSIIDPGLAPAGQHVMTVHVQYTPYHLRKDTWAEGREEVGDLVVELLANHASDLRSRMLHRRVLTPYDLEETYGLTGGHIHHGEMTLNQAFFLRPLPGWARYRTPIRGLYLCGSGAHPGGGITGAPGRNAARVMLRDVPRAREFLSRPDRVGT